MVQCNPIAFHVLLHAQARCTKHITSPLYNKEMALVTTVLALLERVSTSIVLANMLRQWDGLQQATTNYNNGLQQASTSYNS